MAREYEIQGITLKEYNCIHSWLYKNFKRPKRCQHCDRECTVDAALINGKKYERNVDNYIGLCRKCHQAYDIGYHKERGNKRVYNRRVWPKKQPPAPPKKKTMHDMLLELEAMVKRQTIRTNEIVAITEATLKKIKERSEYAQSIVEKYEAA